MADEMQKTNAWGSSVRSRREPASSEHGRRPLSDGKFDT